MSLDREDPKWTAYVLGELDEPDRAAVEKELAEDEEARELVAEIRQACAEIREALQAVEPPRLPKFERPRIARAPIPWLRVVLGGGFLAAAATFVVFVVTGVRGSGSDEKAAQPTPAPNTPGSEIYARHKDNSFVDDDSRSTFSIDVDTASYANVRRFVTEGHLPPRDAVRIEELVNYFRYDYPPPNDGRPFAIHTEISEAPWNEDHLLLRIGLKAREVPADDRPAANLVFLVDVSGSMQAVDKLPLLKRSLHMLLEHLDQRDTIALVVYAGASGLVLPPTRASEWQAIDSALERLEAGGSTNGGQGILLAYDVARRAFIDGGTNRVILATDGDFNVGITDRGDLVRLIEKERRSGVFLTVLGFGTDNLNDAVLEQLADKGNGHYAYIDSLLEAKKVLVREMSSTLHVVAKDVKIQIDFDKSRVRAFRLVGYENRVLEHQDFAEDTKDAGEMGAGHTVTALYELDPVEGNRPGDLATLSVRYKEPDSDKSQLVSISVPAGRARRMSDASTDHRFAAAVAVFGMVLRDSPDKGRATLDLALELASGATGRDPGGYRGEFLSLVRKAGQLE